MRDYMNSRWQIGLLILTLALFSLAACDAVEQSEVTPQITSEKIQPEPDITLNSVEVLRVSLDKEVVRPDARGEDKAWTEAYVVQFEITLPQAMGPAFNIYLNDDIIPEYGEWKGGIYFWVYDPEELMSLNGRTISYRFGGSQRFKIGTLTLDNLERFRQVSEQELFRR